METTYLVPDPKSTKPQPVIKWAGGKRQLLPEILPLLPERIETYYEPFAGGAALFFELAHQGRFRRAVLSDVNPELVILYQTVRDDLDGLGQVLAFMQREHGENIARGKGEEHYLCMRDNPHGTARFGSWCSVTTFEAARTVFLNKTCFNGLYRLNREGKFNVPYGKNPAPNIYDKDRLQHAHLALRQEGVVIQCSDFFEATSDAVPGDAVYFDPPYLPVSQTSSFSGYVYNAFGVPEQMRLAKHFADLGKRGVCAVLSNSHTPETVALFGPPHELRVLGARRGINSKAEKRGSVNEILSVARVS